MQLFLFAQAKQMWPSYTAFEQDQVLLESCLQNCMTYTSVKCTVNKLLMMGRGTARNM